MISNLKSQISKPRQKGLSLIEMTIAIAILVVALLSALVLATFGIVAGGESEMRVVAINLAREGVEVVRNIRDSNWIDPSITDWLEEIWVSGKPRAIPVFSITANDWSLHHKVYGAFDPTNPSSMANIVDAQLYLSDSLYKQSDGGGTPKTNFYRLLDLEKISDEELKVTCYVAYQERGRWHLVNVEDHLFNWY